MTSSNKLTLFILDDNIPKIEEYVSISLYDGRIDAEYLDHLVRSANWPGQYNLKKLTALILESEHFLSGLMNVYGFTHPALCLNEIDEGLIPDIVIYDWEYGSETNNQSSNWLLEILNSTNAFVFVYSMVRNEIPPFLNKSNFDIYSNRFQLFLKGDMNSSVFTAEEFIHQYIVSKISMSNEIKIQGLTINFLENGYLKNPTDILYLERLFSTTELIEKLRSMGMEISNNTLEDLFGNINDKVLFDSKRNMLISTNANLLKNKFNPNEELNILDVVKKYGIHKLIEVLEIGIVKI